MANLKDTAMAYVGRKDISELDKVPMDIEIITSKWTDKVTKVENTSNYFELNGTKYSVKNQVLNKLKEILAVRPQTKFVKVNKNTDGSYTVIPLD